MVQEVPEIVQKRLQKVQEVLEIVQEWPHNNSHCITSKLCYI